MTDARSLSRLRGVGQVKSTRAQVAEKRLQAQRAVCAALRDEADGHRREIAIITERLDALIQGAQTGKGCTDADRLRRPQAYRYWIHFDLEREQYHLQETLDQLAEQERVLDQCRRQWLIARARTQDMDERIRQQRSQLSREHEARQELEGEDLLGRAQVRRV